MIEIILAIVFGAVIFIPLGIAWFYAWESRKNGRAK